jgi:hypothetical protein
VRWLLGEYEDVLQFNTTSFQHGVLESRPTRMSQTHPANLDAGHPCRHDEIFIAVF